MTKSDPLLSGFRCLACAIAGCLFFVQALAEQSDDNSALTELKVMGLSQGDVELLRGQVSSDLEKIAQIIATHELPKEAKTRFEKFLHGPYQDLVQLGDEYDQCSSKTGRAECLTNSSVIKEILNNLPQREIARASVVDDITPIHFTSEKFPGLERTDSKVRGSSDLLEETIEVVFSDSVVALANQLEGDPQQVYRWVHDNITWIPSWGAMQTSARTLETGQGNSADIASLMLALLRESDIPARYAYGVVELAAADFANSVGNFSSVAEAVHFVQQLGLPIAAQIESGAISKVQFDHIWVEADFEVLPSRVGRPNNIGQWVPMDGSIKPIAINEGIDLSAGIALDLDQIAEAVESANVDDDGNWVEGLDADAIASIFSQSSQTFVTAVDALENPNIGDLVGQREPLSLLTQQLTFSMRHRRVGAIQTFAELPNALRVQISLGFSSSGVGALTLPWAQANGKQIHLDFPPSSSLDEQILLSLIPDGIAADPIFVPSYMVNVTPTIWIDDMQMLSGQSVPVGTDTNLVFRIVSPGGGSSQRTVDVAAGSSLSLLASSGAVSEQVLLQALAPLQAIDAIGEISSRTVLRAIGHSNAVNYFAQLSGLAEASASARGFNFWIGPSFVATGYEPIVNTLFGFPTSAGGGGVTIDAFVNLVGGDPDGNADARARFVFQMGLVSSALEHVVLEQALSYGENPNSIDGFSAVKALSRANNQGQRIYLIRQDNMGELVPLLSIDSNIQAEIEAAVNLGRQVIVHEAPVSGTGWQGFGYILYEPTTGLGTFRINGARNGGLASGGCPTTVAVIYGVLNGALDILIDGGIIGEILSPTIRAAVGAGLPFASMFSKEKDVALFSDCLTDAQQAYLLDGIMAIALLEAFMEVPPGGVAGVVGSIGGFLGMSGIMAYLTHFVNLNLALGDCQLPEPAPEPAGC